MILKMFVYFSRNIMVLLLALVVGACSQTSTGTSSGTSSYTGTIGKQASSADKKRYAKVLAARKRARAIRQTKAREFWKKRAAKYKALSNRRATNHRRYTAKKRKKYTGKKRTRVTQRKPRNKYSKRRYNKKRYAKKTRRNKSKRRSAKKIKKSSYAYVGGRSKGIKKSAPWKCVPKRLKIVIKQVSRKFGRVVINSTWRSKRKNRLVGGRKSSYHLRCQAVDFRVHGRTRGLTRWLANHPLVGGYNRYPSGYYHIDTGPKRTW